MLRHLLGVWNPSYENDAMDHHIDVLLRHARAFRDGTAGEDDVYVWWGKLRSPYRQQPLPHLDEVLALDAQLSAEDAETHLYLTDYRSLYVAHLGAIAGDDVRRHPEEKAHIPAYYFDATANHNADCWFKLWDIRRVVLDDTPAVIAELRYLRNVHYHDQRVSLYGGIVDPPLIVTRPDAVWWFDEEMREQLTDGLHWVEFDAERAGAGEMQRELRDHRFGPRAWGNLDPAARSFIATAEQQFRAHRGDAAFDLATVIVGFAKAMELQVNRIVREVMADAPDNLRLFRDEKYDDTVDLSATRRSWSLGALAKIIGDDQARNGWFRHRLDNGPWFADSLPPVLRDLAKVRNPASHGDPVPRSLIEQLRAALIGVGSKGNLVDLALVRKR
jgi:hypothetical protein